MSSLTDKETGARTLNRMQLFTAVIVHTTLCQEAPGKIDGLHKLSISGFRTYTISLTII